jgi:cell division initiation protein
MTLTPEEIVGYDLKQSVRGYSVAQVDDLLDQLADQVEAADTRIEELTLRLGRAEERIAEASETETALKRTLVTAQQTAERTVAEAQQEAERILAEAQNEAEQLRSASLDEHERVQAETRQRLAAEVEEARLQRAAIEERIDTLRTRERQLRERLRRELLQQLAQLDAAAPSEPASDRAGRSGAAPTEPSDEPEAPSGLTVRVHGTGSEASTAPLGSGAHDDR